MGEDSAAARLETIARYVRSCQLCDLSVNRRNAVPGEGDPRARLMIVGEGPGATEDLQGRPFAGKAGEFLNEMLAEAEIPRPGAFITNIVKCRPADLAEGKFHNRAPKAPEITACRPYLVRQFEVIRPAVILCLGRSAAHACIGGSFALRELRGRWFQGPFDSRIIATYHPAFIRRSGLAAGESGVRKTVSEDLREVRRRLDEMAQP